MTKVLEFLRHVWAGMPVWTWLVFVFVGGFNEYINRTKWTKAQTILQSLALFVLAIPALGTLLKSLPPTNWLLSRIATPPLPNTLAESAEVAAADAPK